MVISRQMDRQNKVYALNGLGGAMVAFATSVLTVSGSILGPHQLFVCANINFGVWMFAKYNMCVLKISISIVSVNL